MKLEQSFEVAAPIDRVWRTLIDVEHVAPCLPGASVTGRNEDGSYNGTFTVKIGPTTASYSGKLEMERVDEVSHTATMQAQGTDKRGQGGAKATIFSRLAPSNGTGTRVEVVTDYHITGRLARFGRGGMIEDISERLLKEFAKRLQSSLSAQPAAERAAAEPAATAAEPAESPIEVVEPAAEAVPSPSPESPTEGSEPAAEADVPPEPEPPAEVVEPDADTVVPPAPVPLRPDWVPPLPPGAPLPPTLEPTAAEPPGEAEPAVAAFAEPAPPATAPPATEPPAVAPPPPPAAAPPPSPVAAQRPPLSHPPMPTEPVRGLSLMGSVMWGRIKRNPAPAAAAGAAVVLLVARRRRRRHGH